MLHLIPHATSEQHTECGTGHKNVTQGVEANASAHTYHMLYCVRISGTSSIWQAKLAAMQQKLQEAEDLTEEVRPNTNVMIVQHCMLHNDGCLVIFEALLRMKECIGEMTTEI